MIVAGIAALLLSHQATFPKDLAKGIIEDFESGSFANWKITGSFGRANLPTNAAEFNVRYKSTPIANFEGKYFALSLDRSNSEVGKAVSPSFEIPKDWSQISFDILGGNDPAKTAFRLIRDDTGSVVRTASGDGTLTFARKSWNVVDLRGKNVHLEIEDSATGNYGFIGVDNILGAPDMLMSSNWHVEQIAKKRGVLRLSESRSSFQGRIVFPMPPDDPCQSVANAALTVTTDSGVLEAQTILDSSVPPKKVLSVDVSRRSNVKVDVTIDVQFFDTRLVPSALATKPSLPDDQRKAYLDQHWGNEAEHVWFKNYIEKHGLRRAEGETNTNYAIRALDFVKKTFTYVIPDAEPAWKEMIAQNGNFGNWLYTTKTNSGECLRISEMYANILREAGIPVRQVSGNWVEGDHGHHLRDHIWIEGVGWVPVEPTAAVIDGKAKETNKFFGFWGGYYFSGNEAIGFLVPWKKSKVNIGTFDTLWFLSDDGKFEAATNKLG